jgi:hypothetical protein
METPRIFISMGTPYTEQYSQFRDELESFLRDTCKVEPKIIGKNEYPSGSPLEKIRDVMSRCHGVLVVAYERKYLEAGIEKRGGPTPRPLNGLTYTTAWNHIESAMAYSFGLPLYIICQPGLVEEGLIETKLDWYVQPAEIASGSIFKPEVSGSIQSWVATRVLPRATSPRALKAIEGNLRLSEMTPKEIIAATASLTAAFGLGIGAAHLFPKIFS